MMFEGQHIRTAYLLGIGGIGMSGLARYLARQGVQVWGYDKTPSRLTGELIAEGMHIHFDDDPSQVPIDTDLVIYTPAIPKDLKELLHVMEMGGPVYKRAEFLGKISEGQQTIAVAGTHGKTTITSMIAHIMMHAGKPITALLGGISKNYGTNFITAGRSTIMIVEADEFDRSFLHLKPYIAVITSLDADHLDIYASREAMLESFSEFARNVHPDGRIIIRSGLERELPPFPNSVYYTASNWADFSVKDLKVEDGRHTFTVLGDGIIFPPVRLQVPGRHNVENALAAAAACHFSRVGPNDIVDGLNTYQGVRRRFDIRLDEPGKVFIDDYAHHPAELDAFIHAVKELYPGQKVTGVFQPHLYSRTRDFAMGFARSLDKLDVPILLDIYPAREHPIPGVSSEMVLGLMENPNRKLATKETLLSLLEKQRPQLLVTIGAGDIDTMVEPIENMMKNWP